MRNINCRSAKPNSTVASKGMKSHETLKQEKAANKKSCWIFFQREVKQRHYDVCIGLGNIASAVISRSETRGSCSVQFSVCCGWEGSGRGEGCGGNTWVWRPRTVLGYENVAVAYVATCRTYSTQCWLSSPTVSHFYYHHQPTICCLYLAESSLSLSMLGR